MSSMFDRMIVRYIGVGVISYLVEIGSLYYLHFILGINTVWSVAVSFWIGFIVAYILQKIIAFDNHDYSKRSLTRELVTYSALVAFNYLFTLIVVELFTPEVSVIMIRTGVIIVTTIWNFIIYRRLFRTLKNGY